MAVRGEPEEQLRTPIDTLVKDLSELCNRKRSKTKLIGETSLADLKTRPDFAVSYDDALIGFIEIKAPGKGADPRAFKSVHDKDQWKKLQALPNLIYSDGNSFSLWQNGQLIGEIVHLDGDIESSGATLSAPVHLVAIFDAFFGWAPIAPRTPKSLAETTARLCRLLHDEVVEQMARGRGDNALASLANDWRTLLFRMQMIANSPITMPRQLPSDCFSRGHRIFLWSAALERLLKRCPQHIH